MWTEANSVSSARVIIHTCPCYPSYYQSHTTSRGRWAKQVWQTWIWRVWRAIQAIFMRHPHVPDTIQFFKKFSALGPLQPCLKGPIMGQMNKLLHFPSPWEFSHRVKQYFHLYPMSLNSNESIWQSPKLSEIHEMLTINLMDGSTMGEVALEKVPD